MDSRIFLATVIWLATALAQSAESAQSAQSGRSAFVEMGCHHCHGYEGQGALPTGPRLAPEPMPFEVFSNIVRRPPNVMPAYSAKVLSDEKLKRILEFLESIPEPPDVASIPVFAEKQ